jgi:hypothetical protein
MVDAVLSALGACTAVDVVDILAKRRTPLASLAVDVTGERFEGTPGRLTRIHLAYTMAGAGVERRPRRAGGGAGRHQVLLGARLARPGDPGDVGGGASGGLTPSG